MAGRSQPSALPAQLARLFADGGSGHTLTVPLPAGRLVRAEDPDFSDDPVVTRPLYWRSNAPVRLGCGHGFAPSTPAPGCGRCWPPTATGAST